MSLEEDLEPFRQLKSRDLKAAGLFVAEGRFIVERMLASPCESRAVLCVPELALHFGELCRGRCNVIVRAAGELEAIAGYPFHRGVLGCGVRPSPLSLGGLIEHGEAVRRKRGRSVLVLCPSLGEDANLGGVIRSAQAFGAAGLILHSGSADPYSRRSLRYSMGASLYARMARFGDEGEDAGRLRAAGYPLLALANRADAIPLAQVHVGPLVAAVVGNEGSGLDRGWLERADAVVRIPIAAETDSLNASVAAAIALYVLSGADR